MRVERGKDPALHGSCPFCGRPHFPTEGPTIANGTSNATGSDESFCMSHGTHASRRVAVLLTH